MPTPREIAAWRFGIVSFLIDRSVDPAARRARMRELSTRGVEVLGVGGLGSRAPEPKLTRISKSTLFRWVGLLRSSGMKGLEPRPRRDRGTIRRAAVPSWVEHAVRLLHEQPGRTLTQLSIYLRLEFAEYDLSRASLWRLIRRHPSYAGIEKLRDPGKKRRRQFGSYEAKCAHESWQLDGKGPFAVTLADGSVRRVHVLSVIDDFSRAILAAVLTLSESTSGAIRVVKEAISFFGLPERFQFDRGSAFDSHRFRSGLAALGVHRNFARPRTPEMQGKIEAYHKSLGRWFLDELSVQEIVDLEHLERLLKATVAILWNGHEHRAIGMTPAARLGASVSPRRIAPQDLERAFLVDVKGVSDRKTGVVKLPNGRFVVPLPHAGAKADFRFDPDRSDLGLLVTPDGREISLAAWAKRALPPVPTVSGEIRGSGQLQRLLDVHGGRKNSEPGFGVPEVFRALSELVGRGLPSDERDGVVIVEFYKRHGPLAAAPFRALCESTKASLGPGRPLEVYLAHLARRIGNPRTAGRRSKKESQP